MVGSIIMFLKCICDILEICFPYINRIFNIRRYYCLDFLLVKQFLFDRAIFSFAFCVLCSDTSSLGDKRSRSSPLAQP